MKCNTLLQNRSYTNYVTVWTRISVAVGSVLQGKDTQKHSRIIIQYLINLIMTPLIRTFSHQCICLSHCSLIHLFYIDTQQQQACTVKLKYQCPFSSLSAISTSFESSPCIHPTGTISLQHGILIVLFTVLLIIQS